MARAHAEQTGKIGVCLATAGPVDLALDAILDSLGNDAGDRDKAWADGRRTKHWERIALDAGLL